MRERFLRGFAGFHVPELPASEVTRRHRTLVRAHGPGKNSVGSAKRMASRARGNVPECQLTGPGPGQHRAACVSEPRETEGASLLVHTDEMRDWRKERLGFLCLGRSREDTRPAG